MTRATPIDVVLWFALAGVWSSSYAVIKLGLETLHPAVLVAGRMLIAAVVIGAVFAMRGGRLSWRASGWVSYAVVGVLGSVLPFLLITYGEQTVDSALTAILMGFAPVATVVLAARVLPDEGLSARKIVGLMGALAGVTLLAGPSALAGLGAQFAGQTAILGATLCYAATTVYIRKFVTRPVLETAAGSSLIGAIIAAGAVVMIGAPVELTPSARSLGAVLYLGLFATAAANLTLFYLIPRLGASRMAQINFAVPAGGAGLGVALLGETLQIHQIAALALIAGSVWLTTTKARS